jgi:hypothetical protein
LSRKIVLKIGNGLIWWHVLAIPALGRSRQDCQTEGQLELHGKTLSQKKKKKKEKKRKKPTLK